jgi:hypothetical protein
MSWRAVAEHWDILTTGATRGAGLTPSPARSTTSSCGPGGSPTPTRTGHQAVLDAAASHLYVPTRLLPGTYDIPHPYAPAPRDHADALLAAYDTAVRAATRVTMALGDLAVAVNAPSSVLAAARQSFTPRHEPRPQQHQQAALRPGIGTPVPGRIEQTLRKLQIRDPSSSCARP